MNCFGLVTTRRSHAYTAHALRSFFDWGFHMAFDAPTGRPLTLAEQGERSHPGITSALWQLFLRRKPASGDACGYERSSPQAGTLAATELATNN